MALEEWQTTQVRMKKSIFIKKIKSSAETSLQMPNSTWH